MNKNPALSNKKNVSIYVESGSRERIGFDYPSDFHPPSTRSKETKKIFRHNRYQCLF